jgi:hypothetical protein
MKAPTFKIGDRVCFERHRPSLTAMSHGVVVYYRGKLQPRHPRVRWDSGWGTTEPADELRLLTDLEADTLPIPETFQGDKHITITSTNQKSL